MKILHYILICTSLALHWSCSTQRNIEVTYGDHKYMSEYIVIGFNQYNSWILKEKLKPGNYHVVRKTKCKKDTVQFGTYSKSRTLTEWIKWPSIDCEENEDILRVKNKIAHRNYKEGKLIKETKYSGNSGNICFENIQTKEYTERRYFNNSGHIERKRIFKNNSEIEHYIYPDSLKGEAYYSKIEGNILEDNLFICEVVDSKKVIAKGKLSINIDAGRSIDVSNMNFTFEGDWEYYDKSGKLIGQANFNNGALNTYDTYTKSQLDLSKIESMNFVEPVAYRTECELQ